MDAQLPTPAEVEPWVRAIIGLWDDPVWYSEQSSRALEGSRRWSPDALERQYVELFQNIGGRRCFTTPSETGDAQLRS